MLLELLAAAAAIVNTDHPPGWKPPSWYKQPSAQQIEAAWPVEAERRGEAGRVELGCVVNIHGLVEDCRVLSEEPPHLGFGGAALLLVPDFMFKPATVMGQPVPGAVRIPVNFSSPPRRDPEYFPPDTFTLVNRPTWRAAPMFADVGAAYPRNGGGAAGYSAFRCQVDKTGSLKRCDLLREEPPDQGFGRAARGLIDKFRMEVAPDLLAQKGTLVVNLSIRLIDPTSDEFKTRRLGEPTWTKVLDPAAAQALFPSDAAAKGVKEGVGVASCAVAADGTLKDCAPGIGKPDGLGFSEAAVTVAKVLQMNPWTQEGGPVDGSRVKLPIRFELAETKPKSDANALATSAPSPKP